MASEGRTVMVEGRIVWANDLFKGKQKTDQQSRQPLFNTDGSPKMEYGFGLAVPKSVLNQTGPQQPGEIWAAIHEEARTLYPSGQVPPGFAWKYKDGDGIDHNGASFALREGYAGHLVFACTTSLPIKFFRFENGMNTQVNEGIKCGDYVRVQLGIKAHAAVGTSKPGLYLNPNAVLFLGYGKEIINTPSGDQIFGTQAPSLPPGASAVPVAPQGGLLVPTGAQQSAPGYPPPAAMGTPVAPQGFAPPQQPMQPVQPHYGVLPPQHQPQQPAAPQGFAPPQMQQPQAPQYQQPAAPMGNGYAPQVMQQPQGPGSMATQNGGQPMNTSPATQPAYPSNPPMPGGVPYPGQR